MLCLVHWVAHFGETKWNSVFVKPLFLCVETFVHLCVGSYRLVELLRKVYSFEGQLGEIGGKANLVDKKYVGGADNDNVTMTIF